jgi:hypothetical protein
MAMLVFEINKRQPLAEGRSFGATGAYERIDGIAHFGDRSASGPTAWSYRGKRPIRFSLNLFRATIEKGSIES